MKISVFLFLYESVKRVIHSKYDKRIELYDKGIKQWDTNVSVTMVVRGEK